MRRAALICVVLTSLAALAQEKPPAPSPAELAKKPPYERMLKAADAKLAALLV